MISAGDSNSLELLQTDIQNQLRYHISIDQNMLSQIVSPRRIVFFIIMGATVVLGIAIVIVLSLINYRPVDTLMRRNERLQKNLAVILAENKIHSRNKLLQGLINNKDKIICREKLEIEGIKLDHSWYFVAVVHADPLNTILLHSFYEFELRDSIGYGVEMEGENLIALLICSTCDNPDIQVELRRQIEDTPISSSDKVLQKRIQQDYQPKYL